MKKGYTFSIIGILSLMALSLIIYAFKIIGKDPAGLSSLILNGFGRNSLVQQNSEDEQNQMYNFLATKADVSKTISSAENSVSTTTGYDGLSTNSESMAYKLIKLHCNQISNEIYESNLYAIKAIKIPECKLSATQIKKVLYAIQNDNPGIFWVSSVFTYRYSGNNTIIKLNSVFSKEDYQTALENLNNKISEIVAKMPKNPTEYEAELFIHNYIVDNCKYEKASSLNQNNSKVFTSYGCLIENSAVCEGFSKSMQLLMNYVGIKCGTVTGARGSEPHMWNIVKINGDWYHLDVTWDAAGELAKYNYFNVTDEIIKKDHKINEELIKTSPFSEDKRYNFELPVCTASKENYFEKNAVKVISLNAPNSDRLITNKLIESAFSKKPCVYIMADKSSSFETLKKQLFTEKPYKFFSYINAANKSLPSENKINSRQVNYIENKNQNVLIIELKYT